jgi:GMP synthase-like glutamine amidotransferase
VKIGILQTGHAPESLWAEHGDYNEMFMELLAAPGLNFSTWRVLDDEFPPDAPAIDAWVVTGSRCGVYDGFPWIDRLEAWLRGAIARGLPIVGVCFGHQVIARALGGDVRKFDGGWNVGLKEYERVGEPGGYRLLAWHQDQVLSPPNGARVVARAERCRYAGFRIGEAVLTYQAHPEFTPAYLRGLLDARGDLVGPDVTDEALRSLERGDPDDLSGEMRDFLVGAAERLAVRTGA